MGTHGYCNGRLHLILITALSFFVPAAAQDMEPGFAPAFVETFDDPALPEWDLSEGAVAAAGLLRLEPGAQAVRGGDWHNCTMRIRLRRTGPGEFAVRRGTAGEDGVHVNLGNESVEGYRVRSGVAVDLIVERPTPGPAHMPIGQWFTLSLTQLDMMYVVGADDMRLYDLFDPLATPLPPAGLSLAALGEDAIEIDEVVILPWIVEDFSEPFSPAWFISEEPAPAVQDGRLEAPAGAFAARQGPWQELTLSARIQRSEGIVALSYPGHALLLHPDKAILVSESGGQLHELAKAPLPAVPPEPEATMWLDVMLVVRENTHTVLAYGMPLFHVEDPAAVGAIAIEAIDQEAVVDRLLIGPPLPLWALDHVSGSEEPDGQPGAGGEPVDGEPEPEEPNEPQAGVPSADLAVTDLFPEKLPSGRLYLRITNNGPQFLQGAAVTVTCGGTATNTSTGATTSIPTALQGTFSVTLAPGQTQSFATQIDLDLNSFAYDLSCAIAAASAGFADPDLGNNTYSEHIAAMAAGLPSADLAVTDLFPEHTPMGKLHLRITNHGPQALTGAPVTIWCGGQATEIASGTKTSIPRASQGAFNLTIAPGQTHEFPTQIDLDLDTFTYDFSCEVVGDATVFTDPTPGNNTCTEHIEALGQAHVLSADLAVTDLFAASLPSGDVYCRITNHGPDALQNATVGLNTKATIHTYNPNDPTTSAHSSSAITVSLQPGETGVFHTGIGITDSSQYWYEFSCQVNFMFDPDHSNDSYSETIPSP